MAVYPASFLGVFLYRVCCLWHLLCPVNASLYCLFLCLGSIGVELVANGVTDWVLIKLRFNNIPLKYKCYIICEV